MAADKIAEIKAALGTTHEARKKRLATLQNHLAQAFVGVTEQVSFGKLPIGFVQDGHALDAVAGTYQERRGFRQLQTGADLYSDTIRFRILASGEDGSGAVAVERLASAAVPAVVDPKTKKVVTPAVAERWEQIALLDEHDAVSEPSGEKGLRKFLADRFIDGLHVAVTKKS
jgi:hypothetical protein